MGSTVQRSTVHPGVRVSEHQRLARVHPDAMNGHDHTHDAIDLVRARLSRRVDAEDELLDARGVDNEVCQRQILFGQTRVAAMLARALAVHEGCLAGDHPPDPGSAQ